ncbi:hypothetical protein P0Y35_10165 [Kiritimatiellaeota bacterium B1221]|nr:hypothetical protein [Kiritimatiellaeota bacterium B1221]
MKCISLCFLPLFMLLFPFICQSELPVVNVRLGNEVAHPIPEKIFGQFLERASFGEPGPEGICDAKGNLDPEALALVQEMGLPVIRFPGGSDIDYIDWRDMIDHVPGRAGAGRPVTRGMYYSFKDPGNHTITNTFGWDEYWKLQKTLGNETIVVLNFLEACARKKPLQEAALHHVGLLAYCNAPLGAALPEGMPDWPAVRAENGHPEPFGAEYVQIGNEWFLGRWEQDVLVGLGLDPQLRGGEIKPTEAQRQLVADWMKECILTYVRLIREIDPDIKIIIDEGMIFKVDEIILRDPEIRKEVGFLAKHFYSPMSSYTLTREGEEVLVEGIEHPYDYWMRLSAMPGIYTDGMAMAFNRTGNPYTSLGYKMAYTEWNWNGWGWQKADEQVGFPYRSAVGLGVASMYHGFFRDAASTELATQSMLIGKGWDIAAVNYAKRNGAPLHYGAQGQTSLFYRKHHGAFYLPLSIENHRVHQPVYDVKWHKHSVSQFDAVSTAEEDTVYIHMINRSFDEDQPVNLSGFDVPPHAEATLHVMIARDEPADEVFRHFAEEEKTLTLQDGNFSVPPRSISCLVIKK